jgi:hypothetical protein
MLQTFLPNAQTYDAKNNTRFNIHCSGFGGLVVSMLASGTKHRGFEAVGFLGEKNPQQAFLRRGSKAVCPMSQICGM